MNWHLAKEFNRIKHDYVDFKDPVSVYKYLSGNGKSYDFGIVTDNQDPDKLGRIKVQFPHWGENIVTSWAHRISFYSGNEQGWWSLPDVGEQVICGFINNDPVAPIVLGSVYTPRVKPPLKQQPDNNIRYIATRGGSRLILDDTKGEEKIILQSKDANMRLVIDQNKGLNIVNENGDINIKCRKLIVGSSDITGFDITGDTKISASEVNFDSGSDDTAFKSGADVILKGEPLELKGSSGVTAEMKQIAKENDQVVGIDFHQIEVPSASGLQPVPMIPHPYLGKLVDNLSENVKVGDAAAAFKGSKSMFDSPGHIPMPPGVKFSSNPNNEGEVSNMTVSSVLINGKEAATLGSMVKTCGDPQPQETCTIIAVGAPVCLPILLPGMDPEEFAKTGVSVINTSEPIAKEGTQTEEQRNRSITSVNWGGSEASTGDEITLSASLNNQYENASVYFDIYKEGDKPGTTPPFKKVTAKNEGGRAEATTRIYEPDMECEDESINYFFTAKSFNCDRVESGNIKISKIVPEFTEMKWEYVEYDEEENEVSREEVTEINHGKTVKISSKVENLEDGNKITLKIYEEGYTERTKPIVNEKVELKDGMIEFDWKVKAEDKLLEELTENDKLKYVFTLKALGKTSEDSVALQETFAFIVEYIQPKDQLNSNETYTLKSSNGSYNQTLNLADDSEASKSENASVLSFKKLLPGLNYTFIHINEETNEETIRWSDISFSDVFSLEDY